MVGTAAEITRAREPLAGRHGAARREIRAARRELHALPSKVSADALVHRKICAI
jgi:hypothetical protein